jgi:hypothetical protein
MSCGQVFEKVFGHFVRDELRFQRKRIPREGACGVQEFLVITLERQLKFAFQTHDARGAINRLKVQAQFDPRLFTPERVLARLADVAFLCRRRCLYLGDYHHERAAFC